MPNSKTVTLFTSNQRRHISLINLLASHFERVNVIVESVTVCTGRVKDYYDNSELTRNYFEKVLFAETEVFGNNRLINKPNVTTLIIKYNDLSLMNESELSFIKSADYYLVFGASYIKGWLADFLISRQAINIHMGVSPYYRGSSCNFWAMYDGNFHLVGATIHLLSKGLDSGRILFHAFPEKAHEPFKFTMYSVYVAFKGVIEFLNNIDSGIFNDVEQNKKLEIRYSRDSDFNDEIIKNFNSVGISQQQIQEKLDSEREVQSFINPFYA